VFYQDLGFSKPQIAQAVNTFGVVVSIAGGFLGGYWQPARGDAHSDVGCRFVRGD
jgi:PAT family beta-lactamase induction signal transducer AmpG